MKDGKVKKKGASGAKPVHLIEVIPIAKSGRDNLSYFSLEKLKVGQIIRVPLRRSEVPAVITSVKSVGEAKANLRTASYSLKKIRKDAIMDAFLSPALLTLAEEMSLYYATSVGAMLADILPKFIIDNPELLGDKPLTIKTRGVSSDPAVTKEPLVLQMEAEERFGQYRSIIRQGFARGMSILFIAPSQEEAEEAHTQLAKGISEYVFLITSDSKRKEREENWQKAREHKHPILLVSTSLALGFDRADLGTYILERENSRSYRSLSRPYTHIRTLLLALTKITKRELILGDSILSLESLRKGKEGVYGELSPVKWRLSGSRTTLVDMKQPVKPENDSGEEKTRPFEILSPELQTLIKHALEKKEKIFLFGVRKGLSPTTICGDCGAVLPCPTCGAPIVLHKRGQAQVYLCHRCGTKRDAETRCNVCDSWKLIPIGIGTELIAKEVRRIFPLARVTILDKDHANTKSQAKKLAKKFQEEGGVLVGTELALFHLDRVEYSGIVSLDALFSLPDFSAEERIFYLVSRLREKTEIETIIQTRNIGKEILGWSAQGSIIDFYKREIEDRKTFSYPPFSLFIKVESPQANSLKEMFEKWHPEFTRDSMIIRLLKQDWPDKELSHALASLPPNFLIKIDPESIM